MLAERSDSISSLLGEKTPQVLNQQNNLNNKDGLLKKKKKDTLVVAASSQKNANTNDTIALTEAGVKAIQQRNNAKQLNFQQQIQHVHELPLDDRDEAEDVVIDSQQAKASTTTTTVRHDDQTVSRRFTTVPEVFALPPFGSNTIPLPLISPTQRALIPPIPAGSEAPLITVVFDLDETLVFNRRMDIDYAILRPYALHMLNALRQLSGLEIVLWTASTRDTALPVVDQLNSRGLVFDHLIFRNEDWFNDPHAHTKDLRLLGRDMNRVVIVDNQPNCCKLNPANAVLVDDYLGIDDPAKVDATLVNLYYIVDFLVQNVRESAMSVSQTLESLALDGEMRGRLCRMVGYGLPPGWTPYHVQAVRPLSVPAHGHFVRACVETPAPLDCWTA